MLALELLRIRRLRVLTSERCAVKDCRMFSLAYEAESRYDQPCGGLTLCCSLHSGPVAVT
jgi:hypothetical protein